MRISLVACAGSSEPAETASPDVESGVSGEISAPESSVDESEPQNEDVQTGETEQTEAGFENDTGAAGTKALVADFSATNTTESVAECIANGLNADLYEIVPEDLYTDADLNYNDNNSCSTIEMNEPSSRSAISGPLSNGLRAAGGCEVLPCTFPLHLRLQGGCFSHIFLASSLIWEWLALRLRWYVTGLSGQSFLSCDRSLGNGKTFR